MAWELHFLHGLQQLRSGALTALMTAYTSLGDHGVLWIGITLLLLLGRKTRRAGVVGILALALGAAATNLTLKPLIERLRPFVADPSLLPLIVVSDMNSFPSGHTTAAFAAATGWYLALPETLRWRWTLFLSALLMGVSRLYVGVHYPTDVLAGTVIGIAAGFFANCIVKRALAHQAAQSGR